MPHATFLRPRALGVLAVGPLTVAAFFFGWFRLSGPLAGTELSGFELVGLAGRLQALELGLSAKAALWLLRALALGVVVAGVWQIVLAPAHRRHPGYLLSGLYITLAAGCLLAAAILRDGLSLPAPGTLLLFLAALLFGCCSFPGAGARSHQ